MKTKLRRGSITLWDLLGAFLGVLAVLGAMTFLRIRDFERIKHEVRSSLPERSEKRTERGNYGHACGLEQPAPPPTVADGLQVFKTGGRDTVGENDSLGEIARDHTALDEALGEIYVVVGKRLYRLAPVADEEFKQLAAPAVGIFSCIGFHGDNHITSTSKEATAK